MNFSNTYHKINLYNVFRVNHLYIVLYATVRIEDGSSLNCTLYCRLILYIVQYATVRIEDGSSLNCTLY